MTQPYLYPVRKRLELMAAVFAGGYGLHIWALAFAREPLLWAGLQNGQALMFGQIMSLAALIHALGIRINGYWRFSPLLRLAGMTAHACLFSWLAWAGIGTTAGYVYTWAVILATAGAWSSSRDTARAIGGAEWAKN